VDQVRSAGAQRVERELRWPFGVADHHPSPLAAAHDQISDQLPAAHRREIDLDRAFALVQAGPVHARTRIGHRPAAAIGGTADRLDSDHVRAQLGEGHPGQRCRNITGDLDDAEAA
jgi:hypothetical protein